MITFPDTSRVDPDMENTRERLPNHMSARSPQMSDEFLIGFLK